MAPKAPAPSSAISGAIEIPKLPRVAMITIARIRIRTTLAAKFEIVTSRWLRAPSFTTSPAAHWATLRPIRKKTIAPMIWKL